MSISEPFAVAKEGDVIISLSQSRSTPGERDGINSTLTSWLGCPGSVRKKATGIARGKYEQQMSTTLLKQKINVLGSLASSSA